MMNTIHGIQQIGIGVSDADQSFTWMRKAFGMDIPIFDDPGEPVHMLRYTGDKLQARRAILAASIRGGSAFEIWQYTSRTPEAARFPIQLGDTGIFAAKIKTSDVDAAYERLKGAGIPLEGSVSVAPDGSRRFIVQDPWGNWYEVVPSDEWFTGGKNPFGGVAGAIVGVGDIDRSLPLYRDILGYTDLLYDSRGVFTDYTPLPGGNERVRRVLLGRPEEATGAFGRWIGRSTIELVQSLDRTPKAILGGRYWGDLGYIHLCFDVHGMNELKAQCAAAGFDFTVDSASAFDMGDASGRFSYIEDPDGTLIEFVEAYRIPVIKKLGFYLNLAKRNPEKPLPDWTIKLLSLGRVRD